MVREGQDSRVLSVRGGERRSITGVITEGQGRAPANPPASMAPALPAMHAACHTTGAAAHPCGAALVEG